MNRAEFGVIAEDDGFDAVIKALLFVIIIGDIGEREAIVRSDVSTREPRFKTPNQHDDNPVSDCCRARASSDSFLGKQQLCEAEPELIGGAANHLRNIEAPSRILACPFGERACHPNFNRSSLLIAAIKAQHTFALRKLLSEIDEGFNDFSTYRSIKHANAASFEQVYSSEKEEEVLASSVEI